MKAPRLYARRHSGKYVTRGVEELIHAGGAAGIQETPEVFPGERRAMLELHWASVIEPAASDGKQERGQPGNRTSWPGKNLGIY